MTNTGPVNVSGRELEKRELYTDASRAHGNRFGLEPMLGFLENGSVLVNFTPYLLWWGGLQAMNDVGIILMAEWFEDAWLGGCVCVCV